MTTIGERVDLSTRRARALHDDLGYVAQELRLQEAGIRVYYAIDWASLNLLAYPLQYLSYELSDELAKNHSLDERAMALTRQRTSLTTALDKIPGPLVLLPSYAVEFFNHLDYIRHVQIKHLAEIGTLDAIGEALKDLEDTDAIKRALAQMDSGEGLSTEAIMELERLIERDYRRILTLLTTPTEMRQGQDDLFKLVNTKRLQPVSQVFEHIDLPSASDISEGVESHGWKRRIEKLPTRRHASKAAANVNDARACEYVQSMNARLNPESVLVLISNAYAMTEVLKDRDFIVIPKIGKIRPVQGLAFLRARLLCADPKDKTGKIDPGRYEIYANAITQFMGEWLRASMDRRSALGEMEQLGDLLRRHTELHRFLEDDVDYLETTYGARAEKSFKRYNISRLSMELIKKLRSSREFASWVEGSSFSVWKETELKSRSLVAHLGGEITPYEFLLDQAVVWKRRPYRQVTDQTAYFDRLLVLLDDDLRQMYAQLTKVQDNPDSSETASLLRDLYYRSRSEQGLQPTLALIAVLTAWGEWESAGLFVDEAMQDLSPESALYGEVVLMHSVLAHNQRAFPSVDIAMVHQRRLKGLAQENDPRVLRELAFWLASDTARQSASGGNKEQRVIDGDPLTEAIELYERALSQDFGESKSLEMQIVNDLAYYLVERNKAGDLVRSEGLATQLEATPEFGGYFTFRDTLAVIKGKRAAKKGPGWEELREQAEAELVEVLDAVKVFPAWQKELVSRHLDEVRLLGAVPSIR